ncbi:MAG: hypothetical protein ABIK09_09875, partial [Pseudomonadota bacterium]
QFVKVVPTPSIHWLLLLCFSVTVTVTVTDGWTRPLWVSLWARVEEANATHKDVTRASFLFFSSLLFSRM